MNKSKLVKDMTEEEVEKYLGPLLKRFGKRVIFAFELIDEIKAEVGKVGVANASELLCVIQNFNKDARSKNDNDVWFNRPEFDQKSIEEVSALLEENKEC